MTLVQICRQVLYNDLISYDFVCLGFVMRLDFTPLDASISGCRSAHITFPFSCNMRSGKVCPSSLKKAFTTYELEIACFCLKHG